MRGGFDKFPEYHTSDDNLSIISEQGLAGALEVMKRAITVLENNVRYSSRYMGEAQLGRRGLYSTLGTDKLEQGFKTCGTCWPTAMAPIHCWT